MDTVKMFLNENDHYAHHSDIQLTAVAPGRATASMKITPHHLNSIGVVQGGAIFTLADLAFAAAVNSHGTVAVSINANISFVKAATTGTLYARAEEQVAGPRLSTCHVTVTDDDKNLIAIFQGMAYCKKEPFPPTV